MCGKFTSMASWAEVAFLQPLATGGAATNDIPVPLRVMSDLPVIVFDRATRTRRIAFMRWGFPYRGNPNRPDPIHARACFEKKTRHETIETKDDTRLKQSDGRKRHRRADEATSEFGSVFSPKHFLRQKAPRSIFPTTPTSV